MLTEIAAALSSNQAHKAELLATAALAASDLSGLQRSRVLLNRGLALELQGAHAGAILDLTQAMEGGVLPLTEQAFAFFERGMALDGLGRLGDALTDYEASIKLNPASAPALNNRGNVLRRLGRNNEAKRDYLASVAAGNAQPEYPYYGLGQIAEAQNDPGGAQGFYRKALAANPGYKLAADRLEALGAPRAEAMDDGGIIRLRPPKAMETAMAPATPPVPQSAPARLPAVPPLSDTAPLRLRSPEELVRAARVSVPLRPAIMDRADGMSGGALAQLGAWRQEAEANQAWDRAVRHAHVELAGLSPDIVPVDLPGRGRYYRLRVRPDAGAAKFCASLAAKGLDCLPVRD
jgi:tetratricopeptide (TPR) repeat protein